MTDTRKRNSRTLTRTIDSLFVTTKKKKPNENDDEISICEVECQTHGDDTDCVATLIESCETEPLCSSSITDSTNNVKNSELDENHPTFVMQDMRRFSSLYMYEQSFLWLYYSCIKSRLTQRNLEALMRISMEGKDKLSDSDLDTLVDKFKNKKDRY
jgi:hypothetical protein